MARISAKENVLNYLELFSPVKKLGQHFITDNNVIKRSVELANIDLDSEVTILEIGPGPGVLTQELIRTGANIIAIELDKNAIKYLNQLFAEEIQSGKLEIIEGDALAVEWPDQITHIVSNIPYQISSPLLRKIESCSTKLRQIILLLQDEFASRLLGGNSSSNIGPLSLMTSLSWNVTKDLKISPKAFLPPPKIHSRIVNMERKDRLKEIVSTPIFQNNDLPTPYFDLIRKICRHCFNNRRKKIRNTLQKFGGVNNFSPESWNKIFSTLADKKYEKYLGENWLDKRPEEFEIREWVILSSIISKLSSRM